MNFFCLLNRAPRFAVTLLMVFGLCSPALAGQWVVERYEWEGKAHSEQMNWGPHYDENERRPDGTYDIRVRPSDVTARAGQSQTYWNRPTSARVGWNVRGFGGGTSDKDKIYRQTNPITLKGDVNATVTAVLKWRPGTYYDPKTGEYVDDPLDEPDPLYVRETKMASASKNFGQPDGNPVPYNNENPWHGEYFKISGNVGSFDNGSMSMGQYPSWTYGTYYESKIHRINASGGEAKVPSFTFRGQIELKPGYEKEIHDTFGSASLSFGYSVEPVNFNFFASGATLSGPTAEADNPAHLTFDAWISRGSRINPGDTPADPVRRFWSGAVNYSAYATRANSYESVFSPQIYEWTNEGDGSLLPVPDDVPPHERGVREIEASTPTKSLTHDLGEITPGDFASSASQFPKTTTVRGWVKGEGEASDAPFKGKATINWNVPWANVYEVTLTVEAELPTGSEWTTEELEELKAAIANGNEELVEELKRIKGAEVFRKNGPKMVADAAKIVGEEVVELVVDEVVSQLTGGLGRGIRVGELTRTLGNRVRPALKVLVTNHRETREAAGKAGASWKRTIKVKKTATVGKKVPGKPSASERDFDFDKPDAPPTEQPNNGDDTDSQPDGTEETDEEDPERGKLKTYHHYTSVVWADNDAVWTGTYVTDDGTMTGIEAKYKLNRRMPVPTHRYEIYVYEDEVRFAGYPDDNDMNPPQWTTTKAIPRNRRSDLIPVPRG